jgi:azurin
MKSLLVALSILSLTACGGSAPTADEAPAPAAEAEQAAPVEVEEVAPAPVVNIVTDDGAVATVALTGNDMMQYNATEITVAAGRTVKLTLTHVGAMPASAMGHNFVLLAPGTDVAAFSAAGIAAQDTNYIAPAQAGNVLAQTTLVGGGESATVEFMAPAPGTYEFICTFPGHSAMMKGTFTVTE